MDALDPPKDNGDARLADALVHLLGELRRDRDGEASRLIFEHEKAHALGGRRALG